MWGPRTIAKLVQITSITRVYVYDTYNYSIHGVTNQRITGGPHIVVANSDWWWLQLVISMGLYIP